MKIHQILPILCALTIVGCTPPSETVTEEAQEPTPAPVEVVTPQKKPQKGMAKAIEFYVATVCMMADPNFWEGFMGGDGENGWIDTTTEEGQQAADIQEDEYYKAFGYASEEEATADTEKYKGLTAFVDGVGSGVEERCPGLIDAATMAELLEGLK